MVVGEISERVDLLVIGGGPGGYEAALAAAALGREVTLVDANGEEGLGGVCVNAGCIPSKALIEVADMIRRPRDMRIAGVVGGDRLSPDLAKFQRWKDEVIASLRTAMSRRLASSGVTVERGRFSFQREGRGVLSDNDGPLRYLEYRDVVLATGSSPVEIGHLSGPDVVDSTGLLSLDELPESIGIVGGGYIGVELGTAFAKLGSAVTIVEQRSRLLGEVPDNLTRPVVSRLKELGVDLRLGASVVSFEDGSATVEKDGQREQVDVKKLFVAVGRRPNTVDLGLSSIGVELLPDGRIAVDERRLAAPHVAAIGDITPGPALAHKAMAEARVAIASLNGQAGAFSPATIPIVIFSDPEIAYASVDRLAGVHAATWRLPFGASGRALTIGKSRGFVELSTDESTAVSAVGMVGPHVSELIGEAVLSLEMGAVPDDISLSIHPHPTLSEMLSDVARLVQAPQQQPVVG